MAGKSHQADEKQSIRHESNPHKYFHQMLNMADDDLNAPQYRLLGHYVRWAGNGGSHEEGIRETARITHLGKDTVRRVRQELRDLGYIAFVEPTPQEQKDGKPTVVTVLDRWGENIQRYSNKGVPNQVQGYTQPSTPPVPNQVHPPVPNWVDSEEQDTEEPLEEQKELNTSPTPLAAVADEQASSSLRSELPSNDSTGDSPVGEKQDVFEEFVDTLDLDDDLITIAEWEQLHGDDDKPQLYTCTSKDIAEMIAAWWEWVPVRPSVRGKPTTLGTQISIPTNREFAKNLFERGVRPIDFVRVLFPLRQEMAQGKLIKPMPFQYVCPMVDQFVAETWRDEMTSYSKEEPRYAPKKPNGKGVAFGENLWERDDLFVDVPPRYISIQDMDDEPEEIIASQPSEYENWTAEDWAKNGDPL